MISTVTGLLSGMLLTLVTMTIGGVIILKLIEK